LTAYITSTDTSETVELLLSIRDSKKRKESRQPLLNLQPSIDPLSPSELLLHAPPRLVPLSDGDPDPLEVGATEEGAGEEHADSLLIGLVGWVLGGGDGLGEDATRRGHKRDQSPYE
jgi:hypothetical protein